MSKKSYTKRKKLIKNRGSDILEHKWKIIEDELAEVNKRLRQIIDTAGPEISEVGDYVFNGTGKRIRPALFFIAAYRPLKDLLPLLNTAVALELVHTASLLHDDVIDQASIRRGKDTVHTKWNNKISVLSGDYFLSRAFEMLVQHRNWKLMDIIVEVVRNMAEGEVEQAFARTSSPDLEARYFKWIGKKSASFFAGCCTAGSLLGGGDQREQALWSEYGYNLGIAFQLIDDLLDYTGDDAITGKPLYGDLSNRVLTLPLIRTINSSRQALPISKLFNSQDAVSGRQFQEVTQAVIDGDGPDYTYHKAEEYSKRAADTLGQLHFVEPEKRAILEQLTRDVLLRSK